MVDLKILDGFCKEVGIFFTELKKNTAVQLAPQKRQFAEKLANNWIDNYCNKICESSINKEILAAISNAFAEILSLSRSANRTSSFRSKFDIIYPNIYKEIFLKLKMSPNNIALIDLSEYTNKLDADENAYLNEAINCCECGYLKASIVLGWCATVDKIHKKIENVGFSIFNENSDNMKKETEGRFRRFNKSFNILSISDLRCVIDSDLLWVIEKMGLIDINQHTRLSSCFDMRCHSGHPGEAPITKYNTKSFFSDIFEIVLVNEKFKIS